MTAITAECIINHLSEPDEFEAWLMKNADMVVGTAAEPFSCPIHQFLAEACESGSEKFSVGERRVTTLNKERDLPIYTPLPTWASSFISVLDGRYRGQVIGKAALASLQMAIDHQKAREEYARATG